MENSVIDEDPKNSAYIIPNTTILEDSISIFCMACISSNEDELVFRSSTLDRSLTIELWSGYLHQNACQPYLVSKNCLGESIDTLILRHDECYNGVDSSSDPKIEIGTDRTIRVISKHLSTTHHFEQIKIESGELVIATMTESVWIFEQLEYHCSTDGHYELIDKLFESTPIPASHQ